MRRDHAAERRNATTVRASLLRAPRFPDPNADQGEHDFTVSLRARCGHPRGGRRGYRREPAAAPRSLGAHEVEPLFAVDNPAAVIEAVKLAEDRSGDVIVRLYEAFGSTSAGHGRANFDWIAWSRPTCWSEQVRVLR